MQVFSDEEIKKRDNIYTSLLPHHLTHELAAFLAGLEVRMQRIERLLEKQDDSGSNSGIDSNRVG